MISRKEFIKQCEEKFGFPSTEWKSIKRFIPPHGAQIRSLGKDGKGWFIWGNSFYSGDERALVDCGVTHWQAVAP
jgi:predicted secreted acid phosphatase